MIMSNISSDMQEYSRLLALPAEIRTEIYELILTVPPKLSLGGTETAVIRRSKAPSINGRYSVLSILQTCRQCHHEAEEIFYQANHLEYSVNHLDTKLENPYYRNSDNEGLLFLNSIRPRRLQALKAVTISTSYGSHALREVRNLRRLVPKLKVLHIAPRLSPILQPRWVEIDTFLSNKTDIAEEVANFECLCECRLVVAESSWNWPGLASKFREMRSMGEQLGRAATKGP